MKLKNFGEMHLKKYMNLNNYKMLNKKNNKGKGKGFMPKFNFYWIYGIVAVVLILINLVNPEFWS